MDPADADGRRRTQAWMGPALGPASAPATPKAMRWMPNPGELPSYPGAPSPAPAPAPAAAFTQRQVGELIGGRYRLVRMLGQGALTQTWEATHVDLERAVAIKFLRETAAGVAERMVEEARAVARVRHPHVAEFSDFGRTEFGEPFFVMELLTGQTVEQLLARRGVIPWARSVAIARQVAEALAAAHQQGIVHRDLRPGNVFLIDTGEVEDFVKVVDFGLTSRGGGAHPGADTGFGGTPSVMSPEHCRGEQLDPRSDVYAMGCLLFTMITGDPPFVGDPHQVIHQHLEAPPKSLRERAPRQFIPDELEAIVARCLAKLPAQRFADTRELAAELAHLAQFSAAAASFTAGDPSASASRPMGFAGRAAPKDFRELTNSYKPVNQPIANDPDPVPAPRSQPKPGKPSKPSPAREGSSVVKIIGIIGIVLASLVAVVGFGFGMYWLVTTLIREEPQAREPANAQAHEAASEQAVAAPSEAAPSEPAPSEAAPSEAAPGEAATIEAAPSEIEAKLADPFHAEAPAAAKVEPAKKSASKSAAPAPEPEPEPEPAPEPTPESKPLTEPESKAKDKIAHDDLLDPWG